VIGPFITHWSRFATFIGVLGILGAVAATQQSLEFEVSSIKPNVSGELSGDTRRLPDGTYTATNISILNLLPLAWPTEGFEYRNLPDWARRDRYDVTVKPPPGASPAQIQEMWRALFKHRLKLEARNEVREGPPVRRRRQQTRSWRRVARCSCRAGCLSVARCSPPLPVR